MSHHHRHSPQGRSPSPNTLLLFAVLTCIGIMALVGLGWLLFMQPSPKPISLEVTSAPPPSEPPPDAVETLEPVALLPAPTVRTPQEETDPCAPQAARVCLQGDVWWLDGCDRVEAKAEECGAQLCIEGNCEQPDPDGCTTSLYGRCVGDVVETCVGGRTVTVDCGAQGLRCGVGAEGAQCIAPTEQACTWPPGETACDGNRLLFCRDGELQEIDCEALGAVCDALGERGFRCLAEVTTWPEPPSQEEEESCGACGCPPSEPGPEVCDGLDNDGNQLIDDGALCAPVDIVAFVVTDRLGHGSYSEEDIAAELVRTNIVFAQGGHGLEITFRLAATVALRRPEWLELDDTDWDTLLRSGVLQGVQPDFYIPMVFTDRVLLGGTPKLGAATLPNGSCGGIRLHPRAQGALGAIALAKGRAPTTAAHELGHFLGLCHTHANTLDTAQSVLSDASGDTWVSSDCEVCANEGDGICDTPYDPGPPQCTYNQQCQTICSDGATPDAWNIMSYYTSCRGALTFQQAAEVRRTLALRRGWHACLHNACPCQPAEASCPAAMSCTPSPQNQTWSCRPEGGTYPGQPCAGLGDCVSGAVCMHIEGNGGRCTRYCEASYEGCTCLAVSGEPALSVCREDTGV